MLRMSCALSSSWMRACIAWMTEPAPRKRQALKKACVKTWKKPAVKAPDADAEEHEAELADGGVREHLLDVVLHERDRRGEQRRGAPTMAITIMVKGDSTKTNDRRQMR